MSQTFGYKKGPFVALILVATNAIVTVIYFAVTHPLRDSAGSVAIFILVGGANALMVAVSMSKKIRVSNVAITFSTLFTSTRISFDDLKAVLVERRPTKGGSVEVIIIKGLNSTITFSEALSGLIDSNPSWVLSPILRRWMKAPMCTHQNYNGKRSGN